MQRKAQEYTKLREDMEKVGNKVLLGKYKRPGMESRDYSKTSKMQKEHWIGIKERGGKVLLGEIDKL